ncbi:MAG: flagellar assembly peptidoglycan hydrolase FlgJ [Kangiellaceae bacterium]|nr:flagellar assembly peptidoglycan hydrolase FlgJ [Kangiellaceae bacterium]
MEIDTTSHLNQASIYSDLNSLDKIRQLGKKDEVAAIKKAAQEFEAFFMNMMLKSMRQASAVIGDDSMFGSQQEKMFTGMMDEQLAVNLSQSGHLGIAELMMAQLGIKEQPESKPSQLEGFIGTSSNQIIPNSGNELKSNLHQSSNFSKDSKLTSNVTPLSENHDEVKPSKDRARDGVQEIESTGISSQSQLPEKKSLFDSAQKFISQLLPYAQKAAEKLNLDPRVLISQAALETGWGKFIMHDERGNPGFNLFGIKANSNWNGDTIKIDTLEIVESQVKKIKASFRKYESFAQSFEDYVDFISTQPRYQKAVESSQEPKKFTEQLQSSGYATDPEYSNKIMRIFNDDIMQKIELGGD